MIIVARVYIDLLKITSYELSTLSVIILVFFYISQLVFSY